MANKTVKGINTELNIAELKDHPRNYRNHPDDQIDHIIQSIKEFGFYRNIVIAKDGTILAGHGVVKAARKMSKRTVPGMKLNLDPNDPRALKILAADNEISHLGLRDDRMLTEMLKEIKIDTGLLGTGFDDQMLAALTMVTRTANEIKDFNAAEHWLGMPESSPGELALYVKVWFKNEKDRDAFLEKAELIGNIQITSFGKNMTTWWPPQKQDDPVSVRFEE